MTCFISYTVFFSNTILNMILNMVFEQGFEYSFEHGFEHDFEHDFEHELKSDTNLFSTKQFMSFSFCITSFSRLVLDFILSSSFIRVNVSNSNKISEYSLSEMELSDNALEMRLPIVLSAETANIAFLSCFSFFNDIFLFARFSTTRSNPMTIVAAFILITAGAETNVERRPNPVIPNPIAVTPKQLSITPIILTSLLYFVLSLFRLALSAINISCISSIFLNDIYVSLYHQFL